MAMPAKWAVMAAFGVALATSGALAAIDCKDGEVPGERDAFLEYVANCALPGDQDAAVIGKICGAKENGEIQYWLAGRPVSQEFYQAVCCDREQEWPEEWGDLQVDELDEIVGCGPV